MKYTLSTIAYEIPSDNIHGYLISVVKINAYVCVFGEREKAGEKREKRRQKEDETIFKKHLVGNEH